ncbi:MAG: O-antigen polysaccharide polymerase Wzy family protein [Gemmataceae bacterium]|nr:O-antigen polysaccharide polymerase Wzy family protein [Gemmataceae bacterium]
MPTRLPESEGRGFAVTACVVIQSLWMLAAIAIGLCIHGGQIDPYDRIVFQALCGAVFFGYLFSLISWRIWTGSWFDAYTVFLTTANLFNGGQAMLEFWGFNPRGMLDGQFPHERIVDAVLLVAICLIAMHTGAMLACMRHWRKVAGPAAESAGGPTLEEVRIVGWVLLLLSFPCSAYVFSSTVGAALSEGYLALYSQPQDVGVQAIPRILAAFLTPAALFVLAGSQDSRMGRWASAAVMVFNAVAQLTLGFRFFAMMPLVAYVMVWNRTIKPLPRIPLIAVALFFVVAVFPLIRQTRDAGSKRSVESMSGALSGIENPAAATLYEMGGTLMVPAYTMELIPATKNYDYGEGYFHAVFRLFPNLFWDLHPSVVYGSPSHWLIWATNPWLASKGGSFGFSFIAEAYLSFGSLGAPCVVGLIGFFVANLTLWAVRRPGLIEAKLAVVASFISFFAFFAREELAFIMRPLVWYSLGPYLMLKLLAYARRQFAPLPRRTMIAEAAA